jgi:hypothetical protein
MRCVYITGASNKPSGGVKVMNQVAKLFERHGFESYVVPADGSPQATFLDEPAKTLRVEEYENRLKGDDITIDFWPDRKIVEIASKKKNKTRIFWQHGASIPTGGSIVGDVVFRPNNPYTQHWNVSQACVDFFQKMYGITMLIVHPFFDSPTMQEFQQKKTDARNGFLILARRGQKYLPAIQKTLKGQHVTILKEPYHEQKFFQELLQHQFFISTDDGIHEPSLIRKTKNVLKSLLSSDGEKISRQKNAWIIPKNHLLGFPMPPVEAVWLGCVVIGFAMGGGLEWMNEQNCFLAKDSNKFSLLEKINQALKTSPNIIEQMCTKARFDTAQFTSEHTWNQLNQTISLS